MTPYTKAEDELEEYFFNALGVSAQAPSLGGGQGSGSIVASHMHDRFCNGGHLASVVTTRRVAVTLAELAPPVQSTLRLGFSLPRSELGPVSWQVVSAYTMGRRCLLAIALESQAIRLSYGWSHKMKEEAAARVSKLTLLAWIRDECGKLEAPKQDGTKELKGVGKGHPLYASLLESRKTLRDAIFDYELVRRQREDVVAARAAREAFEAIWGEGTWHKLSKKERDELTQLRAAS